MKPEYLRIGTRIRLTGTNLSVAASDEIYIIAGVITRKMMSCTFGINQSKSEFGYLCFGKNGNMFKFIADETIQVVQTKKLYAYRDSSNEVHWNTLELSPTQRKTMALERAPEFDKEFDV